MVVPRDCLDDEDRKSRGTQQSKFVLEWRRLSYSKTFDLDLQRGKIGERLLKELLEGDKVECKRDSRVSETGNLAIETECRHKPSGLTTTQAEWQAFILAGDGYSDEVIVIVSTSRLKRILAKHKDKYQTTKGGDDNLSELTLMPLHALLCKN